MGIFNTTDSNGISGEATGNAVRVVPNNQDIGVRANTVEPPPHLHFTDHSSRDLTPTRRQNYIDNSTYTYTPDEGLRNKVAQALLPYSLDQREEMQRAAEVALKGPMQAVDNALKGCRNRAAENCDGTAEGFGSLLSQYVPEIGLSVDHLSVNMVLTDQDGNPWQEAAAPVSSTEDFDLVNLGGMGYNMFGDSMTLTSLSTGNTTSTQNEYDYSRFQVYIEDPLPSLQANAWWKPWTWFKKEESDEEKYYGYLEKEYGHVETFTDEDFEKEAKLWAAQEGEILTWSYDMKKNYYEWYIPHLETEIQALNDEIALFGAKIRFTTEEGLLERKEEAELERKLLLLDLDRANDLVRVPEETPTEEDEPQLVSRQQLVDSGWDADSINDKMLKNLNEVLTKYEINTPERLSHFIAQCLHESGRGKFTYEQGSESYFEKKEYGSKYRGVGYIQMTWEYSYKAFATYLALQKHPDLIDYATFKSPNNNDEKAINKQYNNLLNGAKVLSLDIREYTNIVDKGYEYVSDNFAWESAGYDWTVKKLNEALDNGATVDDVSRKINRWDTASFPKRKAFYEDIIKNGVFN